MLIVVRGYCRENDQENIMDKLGTENEQSKWEELFDRAERLTATLNAAIIKRLPDPPEQARLN